MAPTLPNLPGPGTATALFGAVAIYTAGIPPHLSNIWRGFFFGAAVFALVVTLGIEWWHKNKGDDTAGGEMLPEGTLTVEYSYSYTADGVGGTTDGERSAEATDGEAPLSEPETVD